MGVLEAGKEVAFCPLAVEVRHTRRTRIDRVLIK
jgi:hypothetical protein